MNKLLKQFVAFAIAAVMVFGMAPAPVQAVESHNHGQSGTAEPFTSTEDLIQQVKEKLLEAGNLQELTPVDQAAVEAVEQESEYSYNQAMTMLALGFFNSRQGNEGQINTAALNLPLDTMESLVEDAMKAFYLGNSVSVDYVQENGVVTAVRFTTTDTFAQVMDEIENGDAQAETEAEQESAPVGASASAKAFPFTDVSEKHWAREYVEYVYENGLMQGANTANTQFQPNTKLSRAMVVTILWRMAGEPNPTGTSKFTDVAANQWYTKAVAWAAENGIVKGMSATTFAPKADVTREQMVTFLGRYAEFKGESTASSMSLSKFSDGGKVSDWAQTYVKWAAESEIVGGYPDGTFKPKGTATRAEFAKIITVYDRDSAHKLTHVAAVGATCATDGNIEYWYCEHCGKYFADADGTKEITKESTVIAKDTNAHNPQYVAEVSPTCCTTGVAAHYKCACGMVLDSNGNFVSDTATLILDATGHTPADASEATWNWERNVAYNFATDADGNPTFNQGLTDADGNPVPDFPVDENGNLQAALYFNEETGEITAGYQEIITWTCDSVTFTCAGCGEEFTKDVTVEKYVMTEDWINDYVNAYAEELAMQAISDYVTDKAMAYYAEHGEAPSDEQTNAWVQEAQNDPEVMGSVQQEAEIKAYELYHNLNSEIYKATCAADDVATFTTEVNQTEDQLKRDWATMTAFNAYYPEYFGLVAPYWNSKNTETSPLGAVIYMCSQEEQPFIPNYDMDYMVAMLTQAFMSYVMEYSELLDAMLEQAMAVVDHDELDDIDKLLLLHDWLAQNGTFDMQSLVDITSGESSGNDPIAMTAFGVLLNDQIEKGENATWDGGVCLGYAAAYALLVQQAFGKTQEDEAIIDFVKIQYLTNVAESSVAAGDSGFGDGDAMFNSSHYLNAVNLNGTWYYIDACYDDINCEVISQYRVETDGNVSHSSFLLAPSTWEEMYDGNYQYMDSLYDGKVWNRVPDGEGGYVKMDDEGNQYTESEADKLQEEAEEAGESIQMFYYYEPTETDAETRYEDTTYEEAWFVGANSAINYDPETKYFYYTAGAVTSYSTMKDMFGDDDDSSSDTGMDMDQADMLEYKYDPAAQDKIVRRPVDAQNEPTDSGNSFSMSQASDEFAETLFHFGYGSIGAEAQADVDADNEDNSMTGGSGSVTDEEKGPYYDLCADDQIYQSNYPDIVHSTVMMDGKLYFNIGNAIYTFNSTAADMAKNSISSLTNLELVKVKEYNEFGYSSNGKRFTGMSFELTSGSTLKYHPIAALSVHKDYKNDGVETLYVSLGTNLSNSYKNADDEAYAVEARNYNPDYYRFMEEDEEDTSEDTNDNVEFMWCANVVEKMPVDELIADLTSTSTETVSVAAYCNYDAFTEERTTKFGLTAGEKVVEEGTATKHTYVMDEEEGINICSVCLEAHDHDYTYATGEDIEFTWTSTTETVTNEDGTTTEVTKLDATASVPCGNDEYCDVPAEAECEVVENEDGSFTATATYGTITATETKTVNQYNHPEHTYGQPEFTWTWVVDEAATEETAEVGHWEATATFTCTEKGKTCELTDGLDVITVECTVAANEDGDYVATCVGPDEQTYSEIKHSYSVSWTWTETDGVYTAATATNTCAYCGDTETVEAEVKSTQTAKADCYTEGQIVYDATATFADGTVVTDKKIVTIAKTEHGVDADSDLVCDNCGEALEGHTHTFDPETATYTWNTDHTSCTRTMKCTECNGKQNQEELTDATQEETSTTIALTYVEGKAPTCENEGRATYTATFSDETTHTSAEVTVSALGHSYSSTPVWSYTNTDGNENMTCTKKFTCQREGCASTYNETASSVVKNEDGSWTATFEDDTLTHSHNNEGVDGNCTCGLVNEQEPEESTPDESTPVEGE